MRKRRRSGCNNVIGRAGATGGGASTPNIPRASEEAAAGGQGPQPPAPPGWLAMVGSGSGCREQCIASCRACSLARSFATGWLVRLALIDLPRLGGHGTRPGAFYSRRGWPPAGAAGSIGAHVRARRRAMTTAERTLGTVARAGGLLGHARWMGRGRRRPVRWPSGVLRVRDVSRQRAGASRPPARRGRVVVAATCVFLCQRPVTRRAGVLVMSAM